MQSNKKRDTTRTSITTRLAVYTESYAHTGCAGLAGGTYEMMDNDGHVSGQAQLPWFFNRRA